jgi:hypothetical protein
MLQLLCIDYDNRLKAYCVTARCDYAWYLNAVSGAEHNLSIQRSIIKGTRAYATLRADLKRGCLLPPLVLAAKNLKLPDRLSDKFEPITNKSVESNLLSNLTVPLENIDATNIYIIDGLQRTNALKQTLQDLSEPAKLSFLDRLLRIEIWLNIPFGALAYRMLLLNAGQKPMSIKHQVEILSMKLNEELSTIKGIEIITTLESRRRTRKGQFQLAKLSETFQAWLQGQPNLDLRNIVMEQLLTESAIDVLGASLKEKATNEEKDAFRHFIEWLVTIDLELPESALQFLSNETVLQGIGAAVGNAERNQTLQPRMERCLQILLNQVKTNKEADPLGINLFDVLRKGIDPAKVNVGQATRDMVFKSFQEYFLSDGCKSMEECWRFAASV